MSRAVGLKYIIQTDKQIACNEQTYLDLSKYNNEMEANKQQKHT